MNKNKTIFILLIIITWIILVVKSEYPDRKFINIDMPVEGNYLAY